MTGMNTEKILNAKINLEGLGLFVTNRLASGPILMKYTKTDSATEIFIFQWVSFKFEF